MAQLGGELVEGEENDVARSNCSFSPKPVSTKAYLFTVPTLSPFAQGIFQLEKSTNQIVVGKFAALYEIDFSKICRKH